MVKVFSSVPPVRIVRRRYERTKRILDLFLSALILPLVLPVMAVCALLILIEDGRPIFFFQQRTGRGGQRFGMLKFRTMVPNAAELKEKYAHLNELTWPDFKITDDPRVTRIGRWLRKLSLDELPQLYNVFRGEMSLVGPRPTSFHSDTYELRHCERLEVPPGITGLWQVSGRSDVDFEERSRLDRIYIEQRGIWLDLKILARTVGVVFSRKGAY